MLLKFDIVENIKISNIKQRRKFCKLRNNSDRRKIVFFLAILQLYSCIDIMYTSNLHDPVIDHRIGSVNARILNIEL